MRIVGKILRRLTEHLLGPWLIALFQNDAGKTFACGKALGIRSHRIPTGLLSLLPAAAFGIKGREQQFGVHRFRIERDSFFQLIFHRGSFGWITCLQECEILVECRPVRIEFQSAVKLVQSLILLPPLGRYGAEHGVNVGIVRLRCHHGVGLCLRVVDLAAGKQQVSEVDPRLVVRGLQGHSARQFAIRCAKLAQMHVRLRQLIMSIGIVFVYLQSVLKLDGGFLILALGAIPFSALQILLLPHIWIAVTPGQQSDRDKEHDYPKRSSPVHPSPPPIETQLNCFERAVHCLPSLLAAYRSTAA